MKLHTMIYVSVASRKVTQGSLNLIAESSARRNARVGVTGLLLYGSGNYFQLIEGGASTVERLYRRIATDERHHQLRLVYQADISHRVFPDWNMGLLNLDEPGLVPADYWQVFSAQDEAQAGQAADPRAQAIGWVRRFMNHQSGSEFGQAG